MTLGADDFAGDWHLSRRIHDALSGQVGRLSGLASLTPAPGGGLRYDEHGTLRIGSGPALEARRSYLWRFDQGRVEVRFEDGRDFHSFAPSGQVAGTDHPCGADFYRVRYDFTRWPEWQAIWQVAGPRKDYTMVSEYRRA